MPLAALAVNMSWEVMWGFVFPDKPPMDTVNQVWALIDVVIVGQYLVWGRRDAPAWLPAQLFVPSVLLSLALGFGVVYQGTLLFRDWEVGGGYVAFLDNVMMSGLFLHWALTRDHIRGQSLWVAITKGLGTVAASLAQLRINEEVLGGSWFMVVLFVACAVLDLAYVLALARRMRALGIARPLRRL